MYAFDVSDSSAMLISESDHDPDTSDDSIIATYILSGDSAMVSSTARAIAYEQTVELPEQLVTDPEILKHVVGSIVGVDPVVPEKMYKVRIAYPGAAEFKLLNPLFNLLYGNVSMYSNVRLVDLDFPPCVTSAFRGPQFGIKGLRTLLGVFGRPLLATAIKPRGTTVENMANLAYQFAMGGGDIVKDDQNLFDADFDAFCSRVDKIASAVDKANAQTGRRCLYLPHLTGSDEALDKAAEFIHSRNLVGALVCPMVLGLERTRAITNRYNLLSMMHPALTGAFTNGFSEGIAHGVLLGTLFRLAGADISVFPAPGGRFAYSYSQCKEIDTALKRPFGNLRKAMPSPGGGMRFELIPELIRNYGIDSVLLIGGALHGYGADLSESTSRFLDAIRANSRETLEPPGELIGSSCELPSFPTPAMKTHLAWQAGFKWVDREDRPYKSDSALEFKGVRRVELIGKNGERCAFDLRYFELEPDGYTSLEKHVHSHVLIGARGEGIVQVDTETYRLKPNDIVYIDSLKVHQLQNRSANHFGFYCIVDHSRDKPMAP